MKGCNYHIIMKGCNCPFFWRKKTHKKMSSPQPFRYEIPMLSLSSWLVLLAVLQNVTLHQSAIWLVNFNSAAIGISLAKSHHQLVYMILVATTYHFKLAITILWNVDSYVSRVRWKKRTSAIRKSLETCLFCLMALSFLGSLHLFSRWDFHHDQEKRNTMAMWPASKAGFNWIFWGL